jgi:hypothetical protein
MKASDIPHGQKQKFIETSIVARYQKMTRKGVYFILSVTLLVSSIVKFMRKQLMDPHICLLCLRHNFIRIDASTHQKITMNPTPTWIYFSLPFLLGSINLHYLFWGNHIILGRGSKRGLCKRHKKHCRVRWLPGMESSSIV